jgi:hypothetical protein
MVTLQGFPAHDHSLYEQLLGFASNHMPASPLLSSIGRKITRLKIDLVPSFFSKIPPISTRENEYFGLVPLAAFATSLVDSSFLKNGFLSSAAFGLGFLGRSSFKDDASFTLFAIHTAKFGYNTAHFLRYHDFSSVLGAAFDLAIAAKAGLMLTNRNRTQFHFRPH